MANERITDAFQRPLRDLRISVTDRCNFRCSYCMPATGSYHFLPRQDLLSFEEIAGLCEVFASLGTKKLRLTGGEPLLRKDLSKLITLLAKIPGIEDIALTTNGFFLAHHAQALKDAGLQRVTVSLDSLRKEVFQASSGKPVSPEVVLSAIAEASRVGLTVKINTVVQRGVNEDELVDLARHFRILGHGIRFIEYMDVGTVNGWNLEHVVPASEVLARIHAVFPCEPVVANYRGEVAQRYRYCDGQGEFGLITSVTQPFCGSCNRARLSAEGSLYTCLFATKGHDLKTLLRKEGLDAVRKQIQTIWQHRQDRYSEERGQHGSPSSSEKVEMFKIGG